MLQQAVPQGPWTVTAKVVHAGLTADGQALGLGLINSINPNYFAKTAIQYKNDTDPTLRQPAGQVGGAGPDHQRRGDQRRRLRRAVPEHRERSRQRRHVWVRASMTTGQDGDHGVRRSTARRSRRSAPIRCRSTSTGAGGLPRSACSASTTAPRRTRRSSSTRSRSRPTSCGAAATRRRRARPTCSLRRRPTATAAGTTPTSRSRSTATDNAGGSGVDKTEYREQGAANWTAYSAPFDVDHRRLAHDRVPLGRQGGQRRGDPVGHVQARQDRPDDHAPSSTARRRRPATTVTSRSTSTRRTRPRA